MATLVGLVSCQGLKQPLPYPPLPEFPSTAGEARLVQSLKEPWRDGDLPTGEIAYSDAFSRFALQADTLWKQEMAGFVEAEARKLFSGLKPEMEVLPEGLFANRSVNSVMDDIIGVWHPENRATPVTPQAVQRFYRPSRSPYQLVLLTSTYLKDSEFTTHLHVFVFDVGQQKLRYFDWARWAFDIRDQPALRAALDHMIRVRLIENSGLPNRTP